MSGGLDRAAFWLESAMLPPHHVLLTMRSISGVFRIRVLPNLLMFCLSMLGFDSLQTTGAAADHGGNGADLSAVAPGQSDGGEFVRRHHRFWLGPGRMACGDGPVGPRLSLALITMEVDAAEDHVSIRATTPPGAGRNANDSPRID